MEKKKKVTSKILTEEKLPYSIPYIEGWRGGIEEVAISVWSSIHSKLLEGDLIFSYRQEIGQPFQVVVVKNNHTGPNDFAVGMVTQGYSMLLPHIPVEYLEEVLVKDLEQNKLGTKVIEIFKQIIEDFKK